MKKFLSALLSVFTTLLIIESSYRILRALQYRNTDVLLYPLTVGQWEEYAYAVNFKPKFIERNHLRYSLRTQMLLSRLLKFREFIYRNRFGEVKLRVQGFPDYLTPKKNNEVRIIALGASSTYGDGVNDQQTYSARLEQRLRAYYKNLKINVINGGALGTNLEERKEALRFLFSDFSPDILIFYEGHNSVALPNELDLKLPLGRSEGVFRALRGPERFSLIYKDVFESVRFYFQNLQRSKFLHTLPCADREEAKTLKDNFQKQIASFKNNVEELLEVAANKNMLTVLAEQLIWVNNFPLAKPKALVAKLEQKLINSPGALSTEEGFYLLHEKYMGVLREAAEARNGVYFFNLSAKFAPGLSPAEVLRDRVHLTVKGNDLVADSLAEFLIAHKLADNLAQARGITVVDATSPQAQLTGGEAVLAGSLRFLGESYLKTLAFEKFKERQLRSLRKKDEADFNRRYLKFYEEIQGSGLEVSFWAFA